MTVLAEAPEAPPAVELRNKVLKAHEKHIAFGRFTRGSDGPTALVSVAQDGLKVWDVRETGEGKLDMVAFMEAKKWRCGVQTVDIASDGKTILVISIDSMVHKIELNTSDTKIEINTMDFGYMDACYLACVPFTRTFATANFSGSMCLIDFDGQIIKQATYENMKHVSVVSASPGGRYVGFGSKDGGVTVMDGRSLEPRASCEAHFMKVRVLAFTPDEDYFITGSDDKTLKIFRTDEENPSCVRTLSGHTSGVSTISLDGPADRLRLATGSLTGEIILWDFSASSAFLKIPSIHERMVTSLDFHPSGCYLISTGQEKDIAVYKIPSAEDDNLDTSLTVGQQEASEMGASPKGSMASPAQRVDDEEDKENISMDADRSYEETERMETEEPSEISDAGVQEIQQEHPMSPDPEEDVDGDPVMTPEYQSDTQQSPLPDEPSSTPASPVP